MRTRLYDFVSPREKDPSDISHMFSSSQEFTTTSKVSYINTAAKNK